MTVTSFERAVHVKDAIEGIGEVLKGKTRDEALADRKTWLAFERLLEIVSEASRHISEEMKIEFGRDVPWRDIADLGNVLRHAYHQLNAPVLWDIYENRLRLLEAAIDAMLAANPPPPVRS